MDSNCMGESSQGLSTTESTGDVSLPPEPQPPATKRQRRTVEFPSSRQFSSLSEAKLTLKEQAMWQYKYTSTSSAGAKLQYLCKFNNRCSARCQIWLPNDSRVVLLKSNEMHDHSPVKLQGISPNIKKAIRDAWNSGFMKPKEILNWLRENQLPCPTVTQLNTLLLKLRSGECPRTVSIEQLESYALEKQGSTLPDDAYVLNSSFDYDAKTFSLFWTTNRLMSTCLLSDSVHCDATVKLSFHGFPLLLIGTTDRRNRFHPYGVALVNDESTESFKFLFASLKKFNVDYKPSILIADSAPAITAAFESTFGSTFTRVHCWAHCKKNLDQRLKSIELQKRQAIQSDLVQLQVAFTPQEFSLASKCFVAKWSADADVLEFVSYFSTEYLERRSNWYEGVAHFHPSNNGALEATYLAIKKETTLRERLPLIQFIEATEAITRRWSLERNPDDSSAKIFALEPELPTALQSAAYALAKAEYIQVKGRLVNGQKWYFFPSSNSNYKVITEEEIEQRLKLPTFASFDSYSAYKNRMWIVNYEHHPSEWLRKSTCTCASFAKDYICKHILSIAITHKHFRVLPEVKSSTADLQKKRSRGRPKNASKALIVD